MDILVGLLLLAVSIATLLGLIKPSILKIGWLTTRFRVLGVGFITFAF